MLQCVAVCCSVLQCVAVCCSVLQCVAVCCDAMFDSFHHTEEPTDINAGMCVAMCCSVLQCVAVCCNAALYQRERTHVPYFTFLYVFLRFFTLFNGILSGTSVYVQIQLCHTIIHM